MARSPNPFIPTSSSPLITDKLHSLTKFSETVFSLDSYDKWCAFRPGKPKRKPKSPTKPSIFVNDEAEEEGNSPPLFKSKKKKTSRSHNSSSRRQRISSGSSDEDIGQWRSKERKLKRSSRVLESPSPNKTTSDNFTVAVNDYRSAMKGVGSSAR